MYSHISSKCSMRQEKSSNGAEKATVFLRNTAAPKQAPIVPLNKTSYERFGPLLHPDTTMSQSINKPPNAKEAQSVGVP